MSAGTNLSGDVPPPVLTAEQIRRRRGRSIALGVTLGVFVVLLFVLSWVKGPGVGQ